MFDRSTHDFLRWREHGDARALARVFDRLAPELLRLALHLSRNAADAEDLVQATFLAALEHADRFERGKRIAPWLTGILVHRAHAERRRQQRSPATGADGDTLTARGSSPADQVERAEVSAVARAALDALKEPFRQPTVLRLVHGMEPADIALLLQRSPGTVRAQIHRGIERVRRTLPGTLGVMVVDADATGRGLAAVKQVVLDAGAKAAPGGATLGIAGVATGVLMGKKGTLCVAAALALVVGSAPWWIGDDPPAAPAAIDTASSPAASGPRSTLRGGTTDSSNPPAADAARSAPAATAFDPAWQLRTKVIDGPTKQPIAGALVELFGPRTMTLRELQRECAAVSQPGRLGIPWVRSNDFALAELVPLDVRLGNTPHPFLVPPSSAATPMAAVRTEPDGGFDLAMPTSGGVLAITAKDHAIRHIAFAEAPDRERAIEVWPTTRFAGRVRTDRDEVPPTPLDLLLWSDEGCWRITTDANGEFATEAAADFLMVECRTPGWTITAEHVLPNGTRWLDDVALRRDHPGTLWVARFGSARLHVTDAATGAPIEFVSLRTNDQHGHPRHVGAFFAPDGWLALDQYGVEDFLRSTGAMRAALPNRISLTVWADGYLPFAAADVPLYGERPAVVEAKLEHGALPRLTGQVVRAGKAVHGARVQLRPFSLYNWQHDTELALGSVVGDVDGRFTVDAPAGEYVCEVFAPECETQFALSLPHPEPLVIDLADAVYVEVAVRDTKGQPCGAHNVAVSGARHQQRQAKTNSAGSVVVGPFAPGSLEVVAPLSATEWSWTAAVTARVEAPAGSRPAVTLQLPDTTPIRVSLAFEGEAPATGFDGLVAQEERIGAKPTTAPVATNGMVPLDVLPGASSLTVESPAGERWTMDVPATTPAGAVLPLRQGGLTYVGVVTTETGEPLAKGRVFAAAVGTRSVRSVTTAADGSFRIGGLEARTYMLSFDNKSSSEYRERIDNPYAMLLFRPSSLPSLQPVEFGIQLTPFRDGRFAAVAETTVVGHLLDAAGAPVGSAMIDMRAIVPQQGGELELMPVSGWQTASDDGAFRIRVPRGPRHRVWLQRSRGGAEQIEYVVLPQEPEVRRDFTLR